MTDWFGKSVLQHSQGARQRERPSNPCRAPSVIVGSAVLLAGLGAALIQAWQGEDAEDWSVRIFAADRKTASAHVILAYDSAALEAHYLEHLVWLNAVGAERAADQHSNAWTSDIAVGYWLSGVREDLPKLLEKLKGVFEPIDLPPAFAEQERDILLREHDLRVGDDVDAKAAIEMEAFLYQGNQIADDPIGTPETIRALTYDEARSIQAATHRAERARLVVIGNVSERELAKAIKKAGFPDLDAKREEIAPPPFDLAAPEATTLRYPDSNAAPRMVWRRVVTLPEPVQFDLLEAQTALLRDILDTNLPGGLAGPLRFDAEITRSFDIRIWPIDEDNIEISFAALPDSGVTLAALRTAFEDTFARIARNGIPEATYARVLKRFDDYWPDWEDADRTARWMARYTLRRVASLRQPLGADDIRRLPDRLSRAALDSLLHQLAGRGRKAVAFIGPEDRFE